jgi:hypothetical protein
MILHGKQRLKYTLQKDPSKKVMFHQGQSIEFYRGIILDDQAQKVFRYTSSSEPVLGKYRVTLHDESGEIHKTYTFALSNNNNQLQIEAENAQAMELMKPFSNVVDMTFHQILSLIMKDGIQSNYA